MHMADALISPVVGATTWALSGALLIHCARRLKSEVSTDLVPMMGVLGAFVFAAQMINFSIPGTGSSGHLGGGLLLAALLGPHAAFLVIASVLTVQALFFADGGLLALGCNIFNLGFFPAFIAYPLVYRLAAGSETSGKRAWVAAMLAAIVGLQLGAFSVVLETRLSGISSLPFTGFLLLMQPIHLAIGIVEGLVTAAVVAFVSQSRPASLASGEKPGVRFVYAGLLLASLLTGSVLSWFASGAPDGLEWSIAKVSAGSESGGEDSALHRSLSDMQSRIAPLPDYNFPPATAKNDSDTQADKLWPNVSRGTSVSGMAGGLLTLLLAAGAGFMLRFRTKSG